MDQRDAIESAIPGQIEREIESGAFSGGMDDAERERFARSGRKLARTAFKKGQSGNPLGRAKRTAEEIRLVDMCREKTPEALAVILEIMTRGDVERNRLMAAEYVIDRGWGKAVQAVEHSGAAMPQIVLNLTGDLRVEKAP